MRGRLELLHSRGLGKLDHSKNVLWKRSDAGGVDPVAQEIDGKNTENAFFGVDNQAMLAKTSEDGAEMLSVLCVTPYDHLEVALEGETEGQLVLYPVHLPLEGVADVAETEGHPNVLEQPKWCDGGLADVIGMHRDLMVSPPQTNLVEDLAPSCKIGKIQHVGQRIGIRLCDQVEVAKIATRPPTPVRLLQQQCPGAVGTASYAILLQLLKLKLCSPEILLIQMAKPGRDGQP